MGDANVRELHNHGSGPAILMQGPHALAPCIIPPDDQTIFVGRDTERRALDAWRAETRRVMVLHGEPGVGKTRLAKEWALALPKEAFPGGRYFLTFRDDITAQLARIAEQVEAPQRPDERIEAWADRVFQKIGGLEALVILDDLRDAEALDTWRARASQARLLVVSNASYWPPGYASIEVGALDEASATAVATQILRSGQARALVHDLVRRAAGNAIELVVVASATDSTAHVGGLAALPTTPSTRTFESFRWAMSVVSQDARLALDALARFRAQGTPRARVAEILCAVGWSEEQAATAIGEMIRRHLVGRDGAEGLTLHPLLRRFLRENAAVGGAPIAAAHRRAFLQRADAFWERPGEPARYEDLAHDELEASLWITSSEPFTGVELHNVGSALVEAGRFKEAFAWYQQAVEAKRKGDVHGHFDSSSIGSSLHQVGFCLSEQGQYPEALPYFQQAVEAKRKGNVHGRIDSSSVGVSLYQVGWCLSEQGQYAEALPYFQQAVEAHRKGDAHGCIDSRQLGKSLHEVGWCLSEQGKHAEALYYYQQAVETHRKGDIHGRVDSKELGVSLQQVGVCLSEQNQYGEALPYFQQAVEASRKGDVHKRIDSASLGRSLGWVGRCLSRQGQYSEALPYFQQAVEACRKGDFFGRIDRPLLALALDALATILDALRRPTEAAPFRDEARRLRDRQ